VPTLVRVRRIGAFLSRTIRAITLVARDRRIPKPLRFVAGIGLLPIPGPFDEALLLLVAPVFFGFYREPMREAWQRAERRVG
jgi:hypothetical protein